MPEGTKFLLPANISAKLMQQFVQQQAQGGITYKPSPPEQVYRTREDYLQNMYNWDKLTNFEKGYGRFSTGIEQFAIKNQEGISSFQNSLEQANLKWLGTWAGKLLVALDAPAELVERSLGMAAQFMADPDFWRENMGDAWAASSLFFDTARAPTLSYNEDTKYLTMSIDAEMPGTMSMFKARERLAELQAAGMSRKDALIRVRSEVYGDLSALSFRAAKQDLLGHVMLDPLNWIMPRLKPVERVRVAGQAARQKTSPLIARRLLASADEDLAMLSDVERAARAAAETGAPMPEVFAGAGFQEAIDTLSEQGKVMGWGDKLAIWFTGGDEGAWKMAQIASEDMPWWVKPTMQHLADSKIPVLKRIAKQFTLTPDSKAIEASIILTDAMLGRAPRRNPHATVDWIDDISKGLFSPEYGHAALTPEGRQMQLVSRQISGNVHGLLAAWDETAEYRYILEQVADALKIKYPKMSHEDLMHITIQNIVKYGPDQVLQTLADYSDELAAVVATARQMGAPDSVLGLPLEYSLRKLMDSQNPFTLMYRGELPWTAQMFDLQVRNIIVEAIDEMASMSFGIQKMGIVRKFAEAMKAGESLAFLVTNPAFAVRNVLNNEFTMIARGLNPLVPMGKIDELIMDLGYEPVKFLEAYTMAGDTMFYGAKQGLYPLGEKVQNAVMGERQLIDKVREVVRGVDPPINFADLAQKGEVWASKRAFYSGFVQGWRDYFWLPGRSFDRAADFLAPETVQALDAHLSLIQNTIRDAKSVEGIDKVLTMNANFSPSDIMDEVEELLGHQFHGSFSAEMMEDVRNNLEEVLIRASEANDLGLVDNYFDGLRRDMRNYINDITAQRQAERIAFAQAIAEGLGPPLAIPILLSDTMDDLVTSHAAHAVRMQAIDVSTMPREAQRIFWQRTFADSDEYWGRFWTRFDDTMEGIRRGAEAVGFDLGPDFDRSVLNYKKGWQRYFELRNEGYALLDEEMDLVRQGLMAESDLTKTASELAQENAERYQQMMRYEIQQIRTMDDMMAAALSEVDGELGQAFAAWREKMRTLRLDIRTKTDEFMTSVKRVRDPAVRSQMYREYWQDVTASWRDIGRKQREGLVAMYGDPEQVVMFRELIPDADTMAVNRRIAHVHGIAPDDIEDAIPQAMQHWLRGQYTNDTLGRDQIRLLEEMGFDMSSLEGGRSGDPSSFYGEVQTLTGADKAAIREFTKSVDPEAWMRVGNDYTQRAFYDRAGYWARGYVEEAVHPLKFIEKSHGEVAFQVSNQLKDEAVNLPDALPPTVADGPVVYYTPDELKDIIGAGLDKPYTSAGSMVAEVPQIPVYIVRPEEGAPYVVFAAYFEELDAVDTSLDIILEAASQAPDKRMPVRLVLVQDPDMAVGATRDEANMLMEWFESGLHDEAAWRASYGEDLPAAPMLKARQSEELIPYRDTRFDWKENGLPQIGGIPANYTDHYADVVMSGTSYAAAMERYRQPHLDAIGYYNYTGEMLVPVMDVSLVAERGRIRPGTQEFADRMRIARQIDPNVSVEDLMYDYPAFYGVDMVAASTSRRHAEVSVRRYKRLLQLAQAEHPYHAAREFLYEWLDMYELRELYDSGYHWLASLEDFRDASPNDIRTFLDRGPDLEGMSPEDLMTPRTGFEDLSTEDLMRGGTGLGELSDEELLRGSTGLSGIDDSDAGLDDLFDTLVGGDDWDRAIEFLLWHRDRALRARAEDPGLIGVELLHFMNNSLEDVYTYGAGRVPMALNWDPNIETVHLPMANLNVLREMDESSVGMLRVAVPDNLAESHTVSNRFTNAINDTAMQVQAGQYVVVPHRQQLLFHPDDLWIVDDGIPLYRYQGRTYEPIPGVWERVHVGGPMLDSVIDQEWMERGAMLMDELHAASRRRVYLPEFVFGDSLSPAQKSDVARYLKHVKGQLRDARAEAVKYAGWRRDTALLNYRRRYHFDANLAVAMPYAFWTTHSLARWAIHSIDRPAALTTFLRIRKMLKTVGPEIPNMPSRFEDSLRIPWAGAPSWGGEMFWDPMRAVMPFDQLAFPYERYVQQGERDTLNAQYVIEEWVDTGQISREEADALIMSKSGPKWDEALYIAKSQDDHRDTPFDIANAFSSFHAPLTWGFNYLTGRQKRIGPLTPIGSATKKLYGLMGINPVTDDRGFGSGVWNVWHSIRKRLGLYPFDEWEEYRVQRALVNLAAIDPNVTIDMVMRSMINHDNGADDDLWLYAGSEAAKEFARGSVVDGDVGDKVTGASMFLLNQLGIPVYAYPEGERRLRQMKEEFGKAYEAYDAGDVDALNTFFEAYPEYEGRLALWKDPEERARTFLVDELWTAWHKLPTVHRNQVKDALGDDFYTLFLNQDTANTEAVTPQQMAVWLKMMGGDPPGSLDSEVANIEYAPDDVAWRAQVFYLTRNEKFPNWKDWQDDYFKLDEYSPDRKGHPVIQYWEWRNEFFHMNPDVVAYVDDDYEFSYHERTDYQLAQQTQPNFSAQEFEALFGPTVFKVAQRAAQGETIPGDLQDYLKEEAEKLGLTYWQMLDEIARAR